MAARARLVPIVVGSPLFLQNLDTSVMATALPSIADSLRVPPLHLNLAITSYLISLAVFLPISGWLADRLGAKRVFCMAIAFFTLGSALCGAAQSLPQLVLFRVIQGLGGAMMVPVGRLILVRSVPAAMMVSAMVWFTVPPVLGRMMGPLVGGAIVTLTSWRWIFLINIPFGIVAIAMAWAYLDDTPTPAERAPFDARGFMLLALGLTASVGAMATVGKLLAPVSVSLAIAAMGLLMLGAYTLYSRRTENPIIDLTILRYRTFRMNVVGGIPMRVALGASPFLLPLLFQLGFGFTPLMSGALIVAGAIGAVGTRVVMRGAIVRVGFRRVILGATVLSGLIYMSYALFSPTTPLALIFCAIAFGGLVNSLCMISLGALGFTQVPNTHMSQATTLGTMSQQLSISFGVVVGAALVSTASWWHGGSADQLQAQDFAPAFVVVGLTSLLSLCSFWKLHPDEGAGMR